MSDAEQGSRRKSLLEQIHTGMYVFDRDGQDMGTVEGVYRGLPPDEAEEAAKGSPAVRGTGSTPETEPLPRGVMPPIDRSEEEVNKALGEPEVRRGYIRLSGEGLSEALRYVSFAQIDRVEDSNVYLNIPREALGREG